MNTLKPPLLLCTVIISAVISSCSSNTPVAIPTDTATASPTTLPTATSFSTPVPTHLPTVTPTITPISTISKTRIDLSPELYLDENSSPDNLQGVPYLFGGEGDGIIYHFGTEEWVTALTSTSIFPFDDNLHPNKGELRQHYVQVWRDGKMLFSLPVDGIGYEPKNLLRYEDHWIFWFMDFNKNLGHIVQDGISLNDLHNYDSAFSLFLLDGRPFFFFQRGDQFGVSFENQEILLPYPNISYGRICCEGGGKGRWNPRGTDIMVGFYVQRGDYEYQYIEIGLR